MLKRIFLLVMAVALFVSCEKEASIGGTSTIKGKVFIQKYNADLTFLIKEYYAVEEDVYIIYGDDEIYSDRFRTQYDGSFEFKYLQPGKYKIFTYSKNITVPAGVEAIIVEVEIKEKGETVEIPDIIIKKN